MFFVVKGVPVRVQDANFDVPRQPPSWAVVRLWTIERRTLLFDHLYDGDAALTAHRRAVLLISHKFDGMLPLEREPDSSPERDEEERGNR